MAAHFANSYVDRLFSERDLYGLWHIISLIGQQRPLPEEFWLFCRVFEWAPSRSGIWQYYEGLPDADFERISRALDRFGLEWIAEQYRRGRDPDQTTQLDEWLDTNAQQIHAAVFDLIAARKDCLRDEN